MGIKKTKSLRTKAQEILVGSSKIVDVNHEKFDPTIYSIDHMAYNKAFKIFIEKNPDADYDYTLNEFKNRYREYRKEWQRRSKLRRGQFCEDSDIPLCVDIEVAAICDLACSFCFRDVIFTPDKIIELDFAKELVKQAADIGVPSIKLNWRGEPLLHPQIAELIRFAKEVGILEVMINTNATTLTPDKSKELISAGLDVIIFSFDGGSKETYEKMRPGRFRKNEFNTVYNNIKNFCDERKIAGSVFPRSKIQMVLTNETYVEQENFFKLFNLIVDEVTVTQYNERGGSLDDLDLADRTALEDYLQKNDLPLTTPYMKSADGQLYISTERAVCAQPFQRVLVTFDGRVGMCCHDWGAQHSIGYANKAAIESPNDAIDGVKIRAERGKKGYETFKNAVKPKEYNTAEKKVSSLASIWSGNSIKTVRDMQMSGTSADVKICEYCSYKDAYVWECIDEK
jgi:molybdenum cofactor biosynthesis enzyme MoaA